jgi:hypothetical protein
MPIGSMGEGSLYNIHTKFSIRSISALLKAYLVGQKTPRQLDLAVSSCVVA